MGDHVAPRGVVLLDESLEAMRAELVEAADAYARAFAIAKTIRSECWTGEVDSALERFGWEIDCRLEELAKGRDGTPTDNTIEQWVESVDDVLILLRHAWQPPRSVRASAPSRRESAT